MGSRRTRGDKILAGYLKKLGRKGITGVKAALEDGVLKLTGDVTALEARLTAGFEGAKLRKKYRLRGVVNDVTVKRRSSVPMGLPSIKDTLLEGRRFDAVIIGGGIIGTAAARELARWNLSIAVLEKEEDLGLHASSRNDGMVHPGFAASPGTLKAAYNVRGNRLYTRAAEELGFTLQRPGSILLFSHPAMVLLLPVFKRRCRQNGVPGGRWVSRRTLARWEPELTEKQRGGFFLPTAGIISPQETILAYGENAAANGVEFFFHTAVTAMEKQGDRITRVITNRGTLSAGVVINAAGLWADQVAHYAGDRFFSIHPRKGVDAIVDKKQKESLNHIVGMPSLRGNKKSHSKGGGLVLCVEGNLLLGPTAEEVLDREDYTTHEKDLAILKKHMELDRRLRESDIITYYAGTRAATWEEDFIVQPSDRVANLVHAAGIQSPGVASAPAIAEDLAAFAVKILEKSGTVEPRHGFNPHRIPRPVLAELPEEDRRQWIEKDPAYGRIVCRCEEVSEGEIRDALMGPLPAATVDGVKRRTRAGAGRCHGGFCLPRVMEIMARETGKDLGDIPLRGDGSWILMKRKEPADA
jgi:glycerol-3-phosphate dehydrogenase